MSINYEILPHHMRESAKTYIEHGVGAGSFMDACIRGDWGHAVLHADSTNKERIADHIEFWRSEAPMNCSGSAETMRHWMDAGGLYGLAESRRKEIEAMEPLS